MITSWTPFAELKLDELTGQRSETAHYTCAVCHRHIFDETALAELGLDELNAMGLILRPRFYGYGVQREPILGPLCTHNGRCTETFLERLAGVLGGP